MGQREDHNLHGVTLPAMAETSIIGAGRRRFILHIIQYPHPTLRHPSKPLKRVDANIAKIVSEMFELMYEAGGIGLAANQVDLPYRLFIANLAADPEEGEELVFINPVLSRPKGNEEKEEGCLSLPKLYASVKRPETIHLNAYTLNGDEIEADVRGLAARVVQHETDHLDGVLFIDRLSETSVIEVKDGLHTFEMEFQSQRDHGEIPDDEQITQRLVELESQYC